VGKALKMYEHPFIFFAALILVIFFHIKGAHNYTNLRDSIRDIFYVFLFFVFFYSTGSKSINKRYPYKNE